MSAISAHSHSQPIQRFQWNPYSMTESQVAATAQPFQQSIIEKSPHYPVQHSRIASSFGLSESEMSTPRNHSFGTTPPKPEPVPCLGGSPIQPIQQQPCQKTVAMGRDLIARLRVESTDGAVMSAMSTYPSYAMEALIAALSTNPQLIAELCRFERGNVIVQLLQLRPEESAFVVDEALARMADLAVDQSGAIALTRIFDVVSSASRFKLSERVVQMWMRLASHPYGNFVASQVARYLCQQVEQQVEPEEAPIYVELARVMANAQFVTQAALSKAGSHVVEQWVRNCPHADFLVTAEAVLTSPNLVGTLGFHHIGNYPLQAILHRLAIQNPKRMRELSGKVNGAIHGSKYSLNINRAIAGQCRPKAH